MSFNTYYNLFLDDIRVPSCLKDTRTWTTVKNYKEFVDIVEKQGLPKFISFDHDLEPDQYEGDVLKDLKNCKIIRGKTGYDCAMWLIEYCNSNGLPLPDYQVHSANPVGKENIIMLLEGYKRVTNKE